MWWGSGDDGIVNARGSEIGGPIGIWETWGKERRESLGLIISARTPPPTSSLSFLCSGQLSSLSPTSSPDFSPGATMLIHTSLLLTQSILLSLPRKIPSECPSTFLHLSKWHMEPKPTSNGTQGIFIRKTNPNMEKNWQISILHFPGQA